MADVFTPEKRTEVMSRVRSHGNKNTELAFMDILRGRGITGWRRRAKVFGKPDFVFWKMRVAVFIDGCFWHHCPKHGRIPKTKKGFWLNKIDRNMERDKKVNRTLRQEGWKVMRFWECELKGSPLSRKLYNLRKCIKTEE